MNFECWNLVYVAGVAGILCGGILTDQIIRAARKKLPSKDVPKHLPPSWGVQSTRTYLSWCDVHVCRHCGQRGHAADLPALEPCPSCGEGGTWTQAAMLKEVGRWDPGIRMWILKGEDLIMLRRQAD